MGARDLVESELDRRGLSFAFDLRSGGYVVATADGSLLIGLANLERQVMRDATAGPEIVAEFLDVALAVGPELSLGGLCWLLEPNDYREPATYREPVSPSLDRVLAHVPSDHNYVRWIRVTDLDTLGLDPADAAAQGFATLDNVLRESTVQTQQFDGAPLAMLATSFPSKASLLLAPALRTAVADVIGWPVLAIAPDRGFVILWNAEHRDLIGRLGPVAMREFMTARYPLSVEVFEIDRRLTAIGRIASQDD